MPALRRRAAEDRGADLVPPGPEDARHADDLAGVHGDVEVDDRSAGQAAYTQHRLPVSGVPAPQGVEGSARDQLHQSRIVDLCAGQVADDPPVPQCQDGVRDAQHLVQPMRDEEHAGPAFGHPADDRHQPVDLRAVQRGRGLVEHQQHVLVLMPAAQGAGDGDDRPFRR
ncbi:hypothetical protein LUX73_39680 [Actinomadura madurae]|nr:hypothetical protein [Actinomadura madurae]MCQ0010226.1 hypothetical protein [Actinomadura madurae]